MNVCTSLRDKVTSVFDRCFFIVFIVLFFLIATAGMIVVSIFGEFDTDNPLPYYLVIVRYLLIMLSFFAVGAILLWCCRFLTDDQRTVDNKRGVFTGTVLISVGVIFLIQLVFAFCLRMEPITDIAFVEGYAKEIAGSGSFDCIKSGFNDFYIVEYQNNLMYLLIMTGIYKLTYLLSGSFSQTPVIVLNTIALNVSVLLTVLTAKTIFGRRKAILTLILCAMFAPYYSYGAYYYTDSFSIPFVIGSLYCFVVAVKCVSRKKIILFALSGALCYIGFQIKGSVAVFLIAVLIYLVLQFGIKRAVKFVLPFVLSFVLLFGSFTAVIKASNIIPEELSERYQYPLTHWVMMGVNNVGGYERADSRYTASFPSKEEKIEANKELIHERLREQGFFGHLFHIGNKAVWTWMDGTYYIGYYLDNNVHWTPLHEWIHFDGRYRFIYYAWCGGYQMFLILMMAYTGLTACRRLKTDIMTLLRITVFGLWLFLLIWETNSRYPFNFSPLFMLLAAEGISELSAKNIRLFKRK